MRKLFVVAIALMSLNSFAFYVGGQARVSGNGLTAQVTVCNNGYSNARMSCRIGAEGYTYFGQTLYAYNNAILGPGQCAYAYVYTNPANRFVGANGGANCQWY